MNVHNLYYSLNLILFISERQQYREKSGEVLAEKVIYIADCMNRHDYVPKMPNQSELDLVFDTAYPDVQPYLFRVSNTNIIFPRLERRLDKVSSLHASHISTIWVSILM